MLKISRCFEKRAHGYVQGIKLHCEATLLTSRIYYNCQSPIFFSTKI